MMAARGGDVPKKLSQGQMFWIYTLNAFLDASQISKRFEMFSPCIILAFGFSAPLRIPLLKRNPLFQAKEKRNAKCQPLERVRSTRQFENDFC